MRDSMIFILAIIPTVIIQIIYYLVDPTLKYLLPMFFLSLMPATYIVYKLLERQHEQQKVKSVE